MSIFIGLGQLTLFILFASSAIAAARGPIDDHVSTVRQSDARSQISLFPSIIPKQSSEEEEGEEKNASYASIKVGLVLGLAPSNASPGENGHNLLETKMQTRLNQINAPNASRASYKVELVTTNIVENPIEMSKIVCKQLVGNPMGGVSVVIVDTNSDYIDSIASISFTLALYNIPVIGTTLRDSSLSNKNLHSSYISLMPPNSHQADVWYQLVAELGFKRAFVVSSVENEDLLSRFVDLVDGQQQQVDEIGESFDKFELEAIIEYDSAAFGDEDLSSNLEDSNKWNYLIDRVSSLLDNSICRVFLIHAQTKEDVNLFMNLVDHLNLTSIEGAALILSENTVQLALEMGLSLPSGSIWSQLSLLGPAGSVQVRESFALDALEIVLRSIEQIGDYLALEQNKLPNSCMLKPSDIDWRAGVELYWAIRRQQFRGLTGYISFDENGDRLSARYELRNAATRRKQVVLGGIGAPLGNTDERSKERWSSSGHKTIGEFWNGIDGGKQLTNHLYYKNFNRDLESKLSINVSTIEWPGGVSGHLISGVHINRHLSIVTIEEKPFVWVSSEQDCWHKPGAMGHQKRTANIPCRGVAQDGESDKFCCKGYCMDLLEEISHRLNFTYDLYLAPDNQYGNLRSDSVASYQRSSSATTKQRAQGDKSAKSGQKGESDNDESMRTWNWTQDSGQQQQHYHHDYDSDKLLGAHSLADHPRQQQQLKWAGLMGELVSRRADMAFAPLTITLTRAQAIDFSKPFKFHGFSILLRRASKHTTLASFLQPFHNLLWILVIGVATHVVALTLYLLDRYSTFGLFGIKRGFIPQPSASNKGGNDNGDRPLHLSSSIWFSWSILLNSGIGEHTPKSLSGRVLGIFWSGFAMIVVASYTANLAAFLVLDSRDETPTLSGIDDPRLRSGDLAFNFATVKQSAVDAYLQSQVEYVNLYRKMEEFDFQNVDESIRALRAGIIDALIWDSTRLEWEVATDENCSLGIAGELFGSSGYGIGLQKNSHWTKNVTRKLLELHESGFMVELDKKWISAGRGSFGVRNLGAKDEAMNNDDDDDDNASQVSPFSVDSCAGRRNEDKPETLGIFNIAGIFILFACGLVTSMGLIVLERLCYKHRGSMEQNWWRRLNPMRRQPQ